MSRGVFLRPSVEDEENQPWRLDKSDIDVNRETAFVYNTSPSSFSLTAHRQRLPIYSSRRQLLYMLEEKCQTLIVVGETGSGKSTQIPQYLVEAGWCQEKGKMIGVTEPRRVAATSLATRVAEEARSHLGHSIGYSVRFDACFDPSSTKIKFMTEGILLRELMSDPLLTDYSVIMLDEVHERNTNTDILMGLLRKVLRRRLRDLRLIVSSATVDADYLKDYFDEGTGRASVLAVQGSAYSVDIFYLSQPCPDYVRCSVDTVLNLHRVEGPGDFLVFLTGMEEIDKCIYWLQEAASTEKTSKSGLTLLPLPMYGSLPYASQLKVFRPARVGFRKVIVATNIAETSITIEGIYVIVDCCFVKIRCFDVKTNVEALIVTEISKASAQQRAGRAGRTRPGRCYRLCTEEHFNAKLRANTPPEIQRSDLSFVVLQLKALGVDNVVRFEFPSAPPALNLSAALELLFALGAVGEDGSLTDPMGHRMAEMALHPTLSKMILASEHFACVNEIAIIVSMLQVDNVYLNPPGQSAKSRAAKRNFEVSEGDLLTLLNVATAFNRVSSENTARQWCSRYFLHYKALLRAKHLYLQIMSTLKRFGIVSKSSDDDAASTDNIRRCIVSGLFPNAAYLSPFGGYRTVRGGDDIVLEGVHPQSVLYASGPLPSWVVFVELTHSSKSIYMKDVTVIESDWLELLAPHYYEREAIVGHT